MAEMDPKIYEKIDSFFKKYKELRYERGNILIQADQEPAGIFFLEKGHVREYDITPQGIEVVVNVFKPPAFFPMSWAINRTPNQYFFEAETSVTARLAPADEAVGFIQSNPDVMFDLLSRLYSGSDGILRRMAHLMGGDAKTRLLFELVLQCRRFGKHGENGKYIVKLSENQLAKRAGLSRETVSRQLALLKKSHNITASRQGLIIDDLELLEKELGNKV